ncbi:MAG: YopT-type cysteine protease domain-containing protein [Alphaproteobacteria bacterium]
MHIYELMQSTARQYNAKHFGFDQYWKKPTFSKSNQGGVCKALVFGWLKSSHKHGYLTNETVGLIHSDVRMKHIDQRQTRLGRHNKDHDYLDRFLAGDRTSRGFGALNLTRIGDPYVASTALARVSGYELIPSTANIFWNTYESCGCTMGFGSETMKQNHMVGAYKAPKEFMFFDPNGGLMCFKNADQFHPWFLQQFFRAEAYATFNFAEFVYYKVG